MSSQVIVDLDAEGNTPPGTRVVREGGLIERIENSMMQAGEIEAQGIGLQAGGAWETAWADLALDVHAFRTTRYEYRVAGREQPSFLPRDRVHALLRAGWGDVTVSWNVHAVSGHMNVTERGRFKGWQGHDLALRWRDAFGIGLDLTGGVLNVADRGPSIDPSGDQDPDITLDSVRGRTFFLNATMAW